MLVPYEVARHRAVRAEKPDNTGRDRDSLFESAATRFDDALGRLPGVPDTFAALRAGARVVLLWCGYRFSSRHSRLKVFDPTSGKYGRFASHPRYDDTTQRAANGCGG